MSKIQWTGKTWNVITGCTQISPACENCYAKTLTKRLQGKARKELEKKTNFKCQECGFDFVGHSEVEHFTNNVYQAVCAGAYGGLEPHKPFDLPKYYFDWDKVVFHKECLQDILNTKKYSSGSKVFVNSMSDTFHKDISDKDLVFLFDTMVKRKDLTFQVLTKRADRMLEFFKEALTYAYNENNIIDDLQHIWFGVTAENQEYADKRIPQLLELKKMLDNKIKCFVSLEPMLSAIDLSSYLDRLDWVIVGGENIPNNPKKARLMKLEWVESIYNKCQIKDVPFFFKQWSGINAKLKNLRWHIERCKEFPKRGNGLIMVEKRAETFYTRKTKDNQNAE